VGYYVEINVNDLHIAKENVAKALAAINALHAPDLMKKQAGGGCSDGTKWYSWVGNPPEGGFTDLVDAIKSWRYEAALNDDGSVEVLHFKGEKLGDCQILWAALAPFVNHKAEIFCKGEDGAQWKWTFKKNKFKEVFAQVAWEDEDD
jgi:hypothetical protein